MNINYNSKRPEEINADRLRRNLSLITRMTTNISSLMDYLFSMEIISLAQKQIFMSEKSDEHKCSQLYTNLMKVLSNSALEHLIDGLRKTGNKHVVDLLVTPRESPNEKSESVPHAELPKWWPKKRELIKSLLRRKIEDQLIVEKLKQLLHNNKDNTCVLGQKVTVTGMGGIGKTTTANWFAHHYESEYDHIIWLDCGEGSTESALRQFADDMKIKLKTDEEEKRATVIVVGQMYSVLISTRCLFIFDNVDRYGDVQNFLPAAGNKNHHCLITSRFQYWGNNNELGEIEVFLLDVYSEHDAEEFLKSTLKNINKVGNEVEMRNKLAKEMGYLPLAMLIAVSTLIKSKLSVCEYLKKLGQDPEKHLLSKSSDINPTSLKASLETTINVIVGNPECKPLTGQILDVFGFVSHDPISKEMIQAIFEHDVDVELESLMDYSLITFSNEKNNIYYMHRLLQDVVRIRATESQAKIVLSKLLDYFNAHIKNIQDHQHHVLAVWDHAMKFDDLVDSYLELFVEFARCILPQSKSLTLIRSVVKHFCRLIGADHENTWRARFLLAYRLFESSECDESCTILESILADLARYDSNATSKLIVSIKFNLGVVNERLNKFEKTVQFYDAVVATAQNRWLSERRNPFQVKYGKNVQECEITSTIKQLDDDFPLEINLQCKIITLLLTLNDLKSAWRRMQFVIYHSLDLKHNVHATTRCITISGLKLLLASCKLETNTSYRTTQNRYELFHFLCTKFIEWGSEDGGFLSQMYWNALASVADSISTDLAKLTGWGTENIVKECITFHERLLDVHRFIRTFEFEASIEHVYPNLDLNIIRQLNMLNKSDEAEKIRAVTDHIKCVFRGNCLDRVTESTAHHSNQHADNETVSINGTSLYNLTNFTEFDFNLNKNSVTEINFNYVKFIKYDLLMALNACLNLERLIILNAKLMGGCKDRVYLPRLKVIHINFLSDPFWHGLIKEQGLSQVMNSLSFFYKDISKKDWELSDFSHLGMDSFRIELGFTSITMDSVSNSFVCRLSNEKLDKILPSHHFNPTTLKLEFCSVAVERILQFSSSVRKLTLHSVIFTGADESGTEQSGSMLQNFSNLEELCVSDFNEKPIRIDINNLPIKLRDLKLQKTTIITQSIDGNRLYTEYESLQHLTLHSVTFTVADNKEIELCQALLKHFPNLEELHVSAHEATKISLQINDLPLRLRNLRLANIEVITASIEDEGFCTKYKSLAQLSFNRVIFSAATEGGIEMSGYLQQHFPRLEELYVSACKSQSIRVDVTNLPLKLSHLNLRSTNLVYKNDEIAQRCDSLSAPKDRLKSIYLWDVILPVDELLVVQLFGPFQKITLHGDSSGTKATAALIMKLTEIQSIEVICICNFDWDSVYLSGNNTEFVNWLEQVGVPARRYYFCLERLEPEIRMSNRSNQTLWKGMHLTRDEFDSFRPDIFK